LNLTSRLPLRPGKAGIRLQAVETAKEALAGAMLYPLQIA
jgi:hypothetical protein